MLNPFSEAPTWKRVVCALLMAFSALGLILGTVELVSVRRAPQAYPFAAHFAAEYGWAYASAWHYELWCWLVLSVSTLVSLVVATWLWGRRG